jgi:transcriptional regulator with XRE-family HTH domain
MGVNLTQRQLSSELGILQKWISGIENGQHHHYKDFVKRICEALGVERDDEWVESPTRPVDGDDS